MFKVCCKCKEEKELTSDFFHKLKKSKDGFQKKCKECACKDLKNYYARNKDKVKKRVSEYSAINSDKVKSREKEYRDKNREKISSRGKEWYVKNKELTIKRSIEYKRKRRKEDSLFRIYEAVSGGIYKSIKSNKQGRSWESLVGYSLDDLKLHLENLFIDGMSWENYGSWHIDHILPKTYFNFDSPEHEDFKKCWSLDNLQPLWAEDNIKKSDRLASGECARYVKI